MGCAPRTEADGQGPPGPAVQEQGQVGQGLLIRGQGQIGAGHRRVELLTRVAVHDAEIDLGVAIGLALGRNAVRVGQGVRSGWRSRVPDHDAPR